MQGKDKNENINKSTFKLRLASSTGLLLEWKNLSSSSLYSVSIRRHSARFSSYWMRSLLKSSDFSWSFLKKRREIYWSNWLVIKLRIKIVWLPMRPSIVKISYHCLFHLSEEANFKRPGIFHTFKEVW